MNKKRVAVIVSIIFATLVILAIVFAQNSPFRNFDQSANKVTINVCEDCRDGWYLVPVNVNDAECQNNVFAIWVWSPTAKKWLGGRSSDEIPESDRNFFLSEDKENYLYAKSDFGGAFFYLKKPCKLTYFYSSISLEEFNKLKLAQGWNAFAIHPGYDGTSLNQLKGTCNIIKIASWNPDLQKWNVNDPYSIINEPISKVYAGEVNLIKVSEDCTLGLKIPEPPELALPTIPE